jgi:hypothetical protein
MELTIKELTIIVASFKFKSARARLLSIVKVTCIFDIVVVPTFNAKAMLLVIEPLAIIHITISFDKNALSISFAISPITMVYVSIGMQHPAFPIELTKLTHSFIYGAVWKIGFTKSFSLYFLIWN